MSDYRPIPCIQHERLEFCILKRQALRLNFEDNGQLRQETVRPLDVYTSNGAEWLKFRGEDGAEKEIRLDVIQSFQEFPA